MDNRTKKNDRLRLILGDLRKGYETGDFSDFFPHLREDCRYVSMWVLEPMTGRGNIVRHLTGKGRAIRDSGNFPVCTLVQLEGNLHPVENGLVSAGGRPARRARVGLWYPDGKYCLLLKQTIDGQTNSIIIDLRLDDDGAVTEINICMPELFAYRAAEE